MRPLPFALAVLWLAIATLPGRAEDLGESAAPGEQNARIELSYENVKRTESAFYSQTNPVSMFFVLLINLYQRTLSAREGVSTCQFRPSCSHYGALSIKKYGAFQGTLMTGDRLLRCNPWAKDNYQLWEDNIHLSDPIEDHKL